MIVKAPDRHAAVTWGQYKINAGDGGKKEQTFQIQLRRKFGKDSYFVKT